MNIVFFGSSEFAAPSLKALLEAKHNISCVVTQPDRQKGRGLHVEATAIKSLAQKSGLKVYQPQKINTKESVNFLKVFNADLFVVISYGQILSQIILDIPKIFSLNVHASLLPKYRGAAPMNWTIINGEKTTGITCIKMVKDMDAGPIIMSKDLDILDDDTLLSLSNRLAGSAGGLLLNCLQRIQCDDFKLSPQDESAVCFAPKLKKENGLINWDNQAKDIANLVRGCWIWPGAFTYYHGRLLKICKTSVSCFDQGSIVKSPGEITILAKDGIVVATGRGNLIIEELQLEGKRRMTAHEFIVGHKIKVGERLGKKVVA